MVSVSVLDLLDNPAEIFLSASQILIKYADKILSNPTDHKCRSILVACPDVSEKLLLVKGGVECLFSMGFEEDGDHFVYPISKDVKDLRIIRNELQNLREIMVKSNENYPQDFENTQNRTFSSLVDTKMYPPTIEYLEKTFFSKLLSNSDLVLSYEIPETQQKARQCVPLEELLRRRERRVERSKSNSEKSDKIDDYLLMELLQWFKQDFFRWVDKPKCDQCNSDTNHVGHVPASVEERMWNASRIEMYECTNVTCKSRVRFPRYNNPVKLLETRRGRCGEWANCFALICRSVGFDTRFAVDWTDHVWVEIYSSLQNRWIHADPCENVIDQPLLYEVGWKKNLSYVIAFSKDEIVDVTWRYSKDHQKILRNRLECRENWLLNVIEELNHKRQRSFPIVKKRLLTERFAMELVEFLSPKVADNENEGTKFGGRTSGSLDWRLSRGEVERNVDEGKKYIFFLTPREIEKKRFHLKYSVNLDKYVRVSENNEELTGWINGTFSSVGIQKKIENDWKMSYLAREPGCNSSSVSWKFDFADSGLKIDSVHVCYKSETFHNGVVKWKLSSEQSSIDLPLKENYFRGNDFSGHVKLNLRADLTGGQGSNAWQHTQLFRQSLQNVHEFPLEVVITFK